MCRFLTFPQETGGLDRMRTFRFARWADLNWKGSAGVLLLICAATSIPLGAQTFNTLHKFHQTDGANPYSTLVQGVNGDFYGTTYYGGPNNGGTVFSMTPSGKLTMVYSFCLQTSCADGVHPIAGMALATNGDFYGTTYAGGVVGGPSNGGTIFRITPGGGLTVLHSFCSQAQCADGEFPSAAPIIATDGNAYGTTYSGGAHNSGTVFKITPAGIFTVLYSFCSLKACADGEFLPAGLVQGKNGSFYGATNSGGAHNAGTVFQLTPNGRLITIYSFCSDDHLNCLDGAYPQAGLAQGADGNFYGTTTSGGEGLPECGTILSGGCGTIFKVTPTGDLTTIYSICSVQFCMDGVQSITGLIEATDSNFYGTMVTGGIHGVGTLFELNPSGTLTTLYNFCSLSKCPDGRNPYAAVVQGTDGTFYGTTRYSWSDPPTELGGIVFKLSTGLAPFVELLPAFGRVGATIRILGTNLAGTTSVTFGGTQAAFKVVSSNLITTTVPASAATGSVQLTTAGGVLTSNQEFNIKPQP
jgi:uncharacterized repeat protein (TIGR03803 family)